MVTLELTRSRILTALFFLIISADASGLAAQQNGDTSARVSYTISIEPGADRTDLLINLEFQGNSSGETRIGFPPGRFGTPGIADSIKDIRVEGAKSKVDAEKGKHLVLTHSAKAAIKIQYRVSRDPNADQGAYRPSTSKSHFHFFGSQWRLTIGDRPAEQSYEFKFKNVPEKWAVFSNLGDGPGPYTFKSTDKSISGFIAGGLYKKAHIDVQGTPIGIYVSESFTQSDSIIAAAKTIVGQQGKKFGGLNREFFVISMSPRDKLRAGVAIDNAFVCFVDPDTDKTAMDVLIAHEAFHNWLPGKGTIDCWKNGTSLDEFRFDWFVEGFTEFVARKMLLDAERLSMDQYVALFNRDLREQARNPVQRASLKVVEESIEDGRYSNHHERTSYFRGPLIALQVDTQLRASGERDLIDVMQAFLQKASESEGTLSEEAFFKFFDDQGIDLRPIYRQHIVYGNPVVLDPKIFGGQYRFSESVFLHVDQGFDTLSSRVSGVIQGVRLDGPAYKAGLRDGMIHVKATLSRDAGKNTQIAIQEPMNSSSGETIIEFRPDAVKITSGRFESVSK